MLEVFDAFRDKLDSVMVKAFGHRIVLWGYGYSGRFLAWYAEYYHNIKMDYIIEDNWPKSMPYEFPLFRSSLFDFNYKDVRESIVWLTVPNDHVLEKLNKLGFIKDKSYFDFLEIIYGNDYINNEKIQRMYFSEKRLA